VPLKFWDIRSFGYLDAELTDTRRIGIMTSLGKSRTFVFILKKWLGKNQ
jgi:hypothetical protein